MYICVENIELHYHSINVERFLQYRKCQDLSLLIVRVILLIYVGFTFITRPVLMTGKSF